MEENPADVLERGEEVSEETWRDVHRLLVEIEVDEGKLVCETCGHEYAISQGICNFLLPGHLGEWEAVPQTLTAANWVIV